MEKRHTPSNHESGDTWWAWLTHDMAGARDTRAERAENLSTHPSPAARTHQLRAARAFVAGDLTAAIDAFSKALELSADADATIRADLLRLRSAALLRRREHERALDDAPGGAPPRVGSRGRSLRRGRRGWAAAGRASWGAACR